MISRLVRIRPSGNRRLRWKVCGAFVVLMLVSGTAIFAGSGIPTPLLTLDDSGILSTYTENHRINLDSAFFQKSGDEWAQLRYLPSAAGCLDGYSAEYSGPVSFYRRAATRFSGRWMGRIVPVRMFLPWRRDGMLIACC